MNLITSLQSLFKKKKSKSVDFSDPNQCWSAIEELNWYDMTNLLGFDASTHISQCLDAKYNTQELIELNDFVDLMSNSLCTILLRKRFTLGLEYKNLLGLCYHVVGMGRVMTVMLSTSDNVELIENVVNECNVFDFSECIQKALIRKRKSVK